MPGTATFGGTGGLGGNVYGNIFYDHANTAYFLDPNATGTSLAVAGSVGIGTTIPGSKLDVQGGNINSSGTVTGSQFNGSGAGLTGTAASLTAGAANSVAWGNISSKPGWMTATNLILDDANFNNSVPSGFYQQYNGTNAPTAGTWYNMINVRHSNTANDHGFQIAESYYSADMYHRYYQGGTGNNDGTFSAWYKILDSGNYNSYSPTLTGGGASGTWGINVTGNAATVTNGLYTTSTIANAINNGTLYAPTTGNIGIGTTSPITNAKLHVEGGIRTKWSSSFVQTLVPNGWNTITHNLGTGSNIIFAENGDYNANTFYIAGVQPVDSNSFRFWAVGGSAVLARINWVIFVDPYYP